MASVVQGQVVVNPPNPPSPPDPAILAPARAVYDAFASGRYALMGALTVILLVAFIKRWFGDSIKWVHSDAGGSILALVGATATACAAALAVPGATLSLNLVRSALLVGVTAAGGYTVIKNVLVNPVLRPLAARAPAWAQPLFQSVLWIFTKPVKPAKDVAPLPLAVVVGTAAVHAPHDAGASAAPAAGTDAK